MMQLPQNVTRLCSGKSFSFGCRPALSCFGECCRELDLALTPYDMLRLCRELQMSPKDFFDRYVVLEQDEPGTFPGVYLGMVDDGRASCPFITENGCRVYRGRPGACRAYPVGRGVTRDADGNMQEIHILVREGHCHGFAEPPVHTVAEWFEDQGMLEYNAVNDEVLTLVQHEQFRRGVDLTPAAKDTYLLALYRLDAFHRLVSTPDFYNRYLPDKEERRAILADDLNLLRFGIRWLQKVLLKEKNG